MINKLLRLLDLWDGIWNRINLRRKHVDYDRSLRIHGRIGIYGRGHIRIGKNVLINSRESANPGMGGNPRTVFSVPTGELEIGDDVGMSGVSILCADRVTIGNHVLLGGGVRIMDSDAHSLDYEKRGKGALDVPVTRPVEIGDDVFVGAHAMILKGVIIGSKAIIGAGSVVTHNVPDGEIWAGNPARKIGMAPGKEHGNETVDPVQ